MLNLTVEDAMKTALNCLIRIRHLIRNKQIVKCAREAANALITEINVLFFFLLKKRFDHNPLTVNNGRGQTTI